MIPDATDTLNPVTNASEIPIVTETPIDHASPLARARTVIEPPARWQLIDWRELWRYRELLVSLVSRDIKVRYKQTLFGVAWAVMQPAMQMAVFTVFFGRLAKLGTGGVPEPLFFLCGVLPWFFFTSSVSSAAMSVVSAERLVTKIYFPRLAVPFATVIAAGVDFIVASSLLLVMMAYYRVAPGWNLLAVPLIVLILAVFAAGLGTMLSALNIVFRDFRYVVPFFLQLGMFATPTIYLQPTGDEGPKLALLLAVNPLTSVVSGFRAAVIGGEIPWFGLAYAAVCATIAFVCGCLYFRSQEDKFADII